MSKEDDGICIITVPKDCTVIDIDAQDKNGNMTACIRFNYFCHDIDKIKKDFERRLVK